ncbi:uncharacterized protein HMPREF1541_07045 [Cyphellophora europaea CBS 101466]|uniref:Heterokaryon incompatibility domain-containing protein n=1 Tax=Cyphellophora europaea (strain CBS 101466) TaxID=1220924 RepID=W2RTE2_CYPE1|nr:uncharacterized protein HMPREF1541_07045 [Cyphellophora europaea CBS 101466]ETN39003.1 hypothetical protein HMPREF1541_07045 [Cyphellophora europaea CBS 101466]
MDHLPKPLNQTNHVAVHFYTTERIFKPDDFFTIPAREEYGHTDYQQLMEKGLPENIDIDIAHKFLQDWLFFGLMAQVLGKEIDSFDFNDAASHVVTTRPLKRLLEDWAKRRQLTDREPRTTRHTSHYIRASMALNHARRFTAKYLAHRISDDETDASAEEEELIGIHAKLDKKLTLSIGLLGETLQISRPDLAMFLQHRNPYWTDRSYEQKSWGYSAYCREMMLDKGLCRTEIRRLESILRSTRLTYFVTFFERKDPDLYHTNPECTWRQCAQKPLRRKPMDHLNCDGSQCSLILPGNEIDVFTWVKGGHVPLVRWTHATGIEWYPFDASTEDLTYAAVSHSWKEEIFSTGVDARGRHNRSLPLCQIKRLQDSVDSAIRKSTTIDATSVESKQFSEPNWFYIDALCFPRDATVRATAMQQLNVVYRKAQAVVVWDRDLIQRDKPAEILDANVLIQTGDWCRRLWTLQEAVLARNLYVEFKKGCVSIKDIEEARTLAEKSLHEDYHFLSDSGWPFSKPIAELRNPSCSFKVQRAWEAVQFRQINNPADECLVIAALLDLNVSEIEKIKSTSAHDGNRDLQARRMIKLLDLLDLKPGMGIPAGLIFTCGKRLKQSITATPLGFEWAPMTWLTRQSHVFPQSRPLEMAANLMWRGVQVQLPGILLHPPITNFTDTMLWIPVHPSLHMWYKIQVVLTLEVWRSFWRDRHNSKDIAFLLSVAEPKDRWEIGAVVVSQGSMHDENVRCVQWVCRVWYRLEANTHIVGEMCDRFRQHPDEMSFGERLKVDQKWCIDGVYEPEAKPQVGSASKSQLLVSPPLPPSASSTYTSSPEQTPSSGRAQSSASYSARSRRSGL